MALDRIEITSAVRRVDVANPVPRIILKFVQNKPLIEIVSNFPAAHASSHSAGAQDEIDAGNLGSGSAAADEVLIADGAGASSWGAVPLHAPSHSQGGTDEIDAADLGSGAATANLVLTADGAGGVDWATQPWKLILNREFPLSGDEGPHGYTQRSVTVSELRAVVTGGTSPSVTWTVRFAADRSAAGTEIEIGGRVTTNTTTGDVVTGGDIDNGTIPAGNFVWLEISSATTGVNRADDFTVTLQGAQ